MPYQIMTNQYSSNKIHKPANRWISYGIWLMVILIYIPVPAIPRLPIVLLLFILSLLTMNNETRGFAIMSFAPPVLGALFYIFRIPVTAYFVCLCLGLFFLRKKIKTYLSDFNVIFIFILLIIYFFIAYLYGPQHAYSNSKLIYIIVLGFCSIIYWKSYFESSTFQPLKVAQFLCLVSLLYAYIAFDFYGFPGPTNLLDFNFFRSSFAGIKTETDMVLTYHSVGVPAMMGLAIIFSAYKFQDLKKGKVLIAIIPLVILLLIAQARQAIVGTFIILFIRLIIEKEFSFNKKIWLSIILTLASIFFITHIKSDAIESSMNASSMSQSLNRDYDEAFKIMESDFIFGIGLGGFSSNGVRAYPHNLFLELLCELGFVGTVFVVLLVFAPLLTKLKRLQFITKSNFYAIPLITAIFIRSMMSSDLIDSITFITAIIILTHIKTNKICQQI